MLASSESLLEEALIELTRRLLGREQNNKSLLLKSLLLHIDADFFEDCEIEAADIRTYSNMMKRIGQYYRLQYGLSLKSQQLRGKPYQSEFLHIYQLVMDMLFNRDKNQVIEVILDLEPTQRELMMPFVNKVTQREFVGPITDPHDEEINFKENQVEELREVCLDLTKKCADLDDKNNELKEAYARANQMVRQYEFQKVELLNELGASTYTSYDELVIRLKKERQEFQSEKARLNEDFHERTAVLSSKEIEISHMMKSASLKREAKETVELQTLDRKNRELNAQINELTVKFQRMKDSHADISERNVRLEQENTRLLKEAEFNRKIVEKWSKMKVLHAEFKSTLQKASDKDRQI